MDIILPTNFHSVSGVKRKNYNDSSQQTYNNYGSQGSQKYARMSSSTALIQRNKLKKKGKSKQYKDYKALSKKVLQALMKPEIKYVGESPYANYNMPFNSRLIHWISPEVQPGTGRAQRIGDKIQNIGIQFRVQLSQPAYGGDITTYKNQWYSPMTLSLHLLQLGDTDGDDVSQDALYTNYNSGANKFTDMFNKNGQKFKCVWNKDIECDGFAGENNIVIDYVKLKGTTTYKGSAGTYADISSGALILVITSSQRKSTYTNDPEGVQMEPILDLSHRHFYIDV